MAQKRVSDAFLVNIGQLDHYVVFGTKSGGIQDFQRGKMCPIGVKQTPPDPPKTPLNSPKLISDPPYNQYNPSRYFITH